MDWLYFNSGCGDTFFTDRKWYIIQGWCGVKVVDVVFIIRSDNVLFGRTRCWGHRELPDNIRSVWRCRRGFVSCVLQLSDVSQLTPNPQTIHLSAMKIHNIDANESIWGNVLVNAKYNLTLARNINNCFKRCWSSGISTERHDACSRPQALRGTIGNKSWSKHKKTNHQNDSLWFKKMGNQEA